MFKILCSLLEKTAQLKPDLIEMDVQETKDGQFVMMHDANLKNLTGINATPQDLTLVELTNTDIYEMVIKQRFQALMPI